MNLILPPLVGAVVVVVAAWAGLTLTLGAHPFWSVQVALTGAPIGAVLAVVLRWIGWRLPVLSGLGLVLTLAAFAVAHTGKLNFAASYAEDRFAGQMWFFGWIATALFASLFIGLLWPRR